MDKKQEGIMDIRQDNILNVVIILMTEENFQKSILGYQ